MAEKLVITAALTGALASKQANPAVPYIPQEFAEESYKCYKAGASIVHIHARDPKTGLATPDLKVTREIIDAIRQRCPDLIINMSSAITIGLTPEQRIAPILANKPDMASLNTNSMNFAVADWKTGKIIGEAIFENTFKMLVDFAKQMHANDIKPEPEVYDFGGIYNTLLVRKQNIFAEPMHFQMVFGVAGGIPFSVANLAHMRELIPQDASWSVCGVGPNQFPAGICASIAGGHIRVGLEDNIKLISGRLAKGSWEQVEWAARVAEQAGREVAGPDEARRILHVREKS